MTTKLRTVIIGSQRKAEIFKHLLHGVDSFEFNGFYDPDDNQNADAFGNLIFAYEIAASADVFVIDRHVKNLDIEMLRHFIRLGKHIMFDGFNLENSADISEINTLIQEGQNCVQIANVLYNKPLFTTATQFIRKPRFIKIEKNCSAPQPGGFETWMFKQLAQELDIVLRIAGSPVRNISARPLFLFGKNPDLLNLHIEFDNDSVCHITAGRAVETGVHKFRVFQQDRLFHLDLSENTILELRPIHNPDQLSILMENQDENVQEFNEIIRPIMPFDSWKKELRNFSENIEKNLTPVTTLEHLQNVCTTIESVVDKVQRRYLEV